ncbi:helix-turn-helix domain-containing protein [Streptomyces sp. NPDC003247]|uniref:helix-turn-helix domain-containing protein n=1 Tax=Streptomyces sp. NPDC003247 TaxID=3364677 RepID=UPI0036A33BDA
MSTGDRTDEVAEFAALLTELKVRTGRSYGSLARRLGMNTSTLHRYCAGEAVPQDFAPVERLAEFCGASPQERLALHRRWMAAVAARQRPRTANSPPLPETAAETDVPDLPDLPDAPRRTADTAVAPAPARHRRHVPVLLGGLACALVATLGALSGLPADRPPATEAGAGAGAGPSGAGPSRTTAPAAPHRPSPTPSTSPTPAGSPTRSRTPAPTPGTGGPSPSAPDATAPTATATDAAVPLAWTADSHAWAFGCGHDYVLAEPPARVPPPPAPQDAAAWAAAQGAVHGRETIVEISVQGRSSTAVVLTALRVRVVGRAEPAPGHAYAMDQGCGGAVSPRHFAVDLDQDRPVARAVTGDDSGTPLPAVRLPYRVSAEDPEVLLVTASTRDCDCSWYLELDWSSQGRAGTVRVDDRGRPFRTRSLEGLPRHMYDTSARRWVPYG